MIRIGSGLATGEGTGEAVRAALEIALEALGGAPADLVLIFHTPHHAGRISTTLGDIRAMAGGSAVAGCTTQAPVWDGKEVEAVPAVSVLAASLPGAVVRPFAIKPGDDWSPTFPAGDLRAILILADPFSFEMGLIDSINASAPGVPITGGLASGGSGRGSHVLMTRDRIATEGAVGVMLGGSVSVSTVVAQGCKPIGAPFVVTGAQDNIITTLGGKPPLVRLQHTLSRLSPRDQELATRGLHVGIVIDEYKAKLEPGDFLIRPLVGASPESGAIAIGDEVRVGQTVQFHVRDAQTADEDLKQLLGSQKGSYPGALLFTCNGRGAGLFGSPDHDARAIQEGLGPMPLAGMFCNGEIGPVGGRNFLHGFTASMLLIGEPAP